MTIYLGRDSLIAEQGENKFSTTLRAFDHIITVLISHGTITLAFKKHGNANQWFFCDTVFDDTDHIAILGLCMHLHIPANQKREEHDTEKD